MAPTSPRSLPMPRHFPLPLPAAADPLLHLPPLLPCSDVALIEFIRSLDEKQRPEDRFIVSGDLGDTHLFIKARRGRELAGACPPVLLACFSIVACWLPGRPVGWFVHVLLAPLDQYMHVGMRNHKCSAVPLPLPRPLAWLQERCLQFVQDKVSEWQQSLRFEIKKD